MMRELTFVGVVVMGSLWGSLAQGSTVATIGGVWETSEGEMTISQKDTGEVQATYTQDNGRIEGSLAGNVLTGFWIEDDSLQQCETAKDGSFHWGRIRYVFEGDAFVGTWGYCEEAPTREWTGARL